MSPVNSSRVLCHIVCLFNRFAARPAPLPLGSSDESTQAGFGLGQPTLLGPHWRKSRQPFAFVCFIPGGDQLHRFPDSIWPQVVNIVDANGALKSLNTANSRILAVTQRIVPNCRTHRVHKGKSCQPGLERKRAHPPGRQPIDRALMTTVLHKP
jgi:hypothetical protein